MHHRRPCLVQLFTMDSRRAGCQAWFAHSHEGHRATRMAKLQPQTTTAGDSNGIKDRDKQEQWNKLNSKKSLYLFPK